MNFPPKCFFFMMVNEHEMQLKRHNSCAMLPKFSQDSFYISRKNFKTSWKNDEWMNEWMNGTDKNLRRKLNPGDHMMPLKLCNMRTIKLRLRLEAVNKINDDWWKSHYEFCLSKFSQKLRNCVIRWKNSTFVFNFSFGQFVVAVTKHGKAIFLQQRF
jgi:hypothetical protein